MKHAFLLVAFVTSCASAPAPKAQEPPPPPPPSYQPTSFSVHVAGTGRPVILIPGLGCPASVWDDTVAHLGSGYQTHVLQLAGFAQSNRDFFQNMFSDPKRADSVIAEVVKSDHRAFANAFHELLVTDIRPELPKIAAPVLVLVADGPVADEIQKQTAAIPHHD